MPSKKISIVITSLYPGGMEKVCISLANQFIARGYVVDLVVLKQQDSLSCEVPEALATNFLNVSRLRSSFYPLMRYLRLQSPDFVIAAQWPLTWVVYFAAIAARFRGRVILSEHISLENSPFVKRIHRLAFKFFGKLIYSRAHAVIAVSHGVAQSIENLTGLPINRITTIYNPVLDECHISEDIVTYPFLDWWESGGTKILAAGRLADQKNYSLLIQSFAKLPNTLDAKLLILGEGPERRKLENMIVQLGMQDRIKMPGHVKSVSGFYNIADIFVLSSNYEGLGNVIVEALNAKCKIVSTDCPFGPREILRDGRYGWLTKVGDIDGLTKGLEAAATGAPTEFASKEWLSQFSVGFAAQRYVEIMVSDDCQSYK